MRKVSGAVSAAIAAATTKPAHIHATGVQFADSPELSTCASAGVKPEASRPTMRPTAIPLYRTRAGNCSGNQET